MGIIVVASGLFVFGLIKIGPYFNVYLKAPSVKSYVKIAVNDMETAGLYAKVAEWKKVKSEALRVAKDAEYNEDTHAVLKKALKVAGGKHSGLIKKSEYHAVSQKALRLFLRCERTIRYAIMVSIISSKIQGKVRERTCRRKRLIYKRFRRLSKVKKKINSL